MPDSVAGRKIVRSFTFSNVAIFVKENSSDKYDIALTMNNPTSGRIYSEPDGDKENTLAWVTILYG